MKKRRCEWPRGDPLMTKYHDTEWGTPNRNDRKLFEFIVLDSMQAGLSWQIILHKRETMRKAFAGFDPKKIARFNEKKVRALLRDPGIIRNRLKVRAVIENAKRFLEVEKEFGTASRYLWQFTGGRPKVNRWKTLRQIPSRSRESDRMSDDMKRRGFKFIGTTICYAFMQGAGMINDHTVDCFRYKALIRYAKR